MSRITSAVLQSGKDLITAFDDIDSDHSGTISRIEFNLAVRASIPSLSAYFRTHSSLPFGALSMWIILVQLISKNSR